MQRFLPEVMERLDYHGERRGDALVYRGDNSEVAMTIRRQKAYDHEVQLICKNSLDLVVHMHRHNEDVEGYTLNHALEFLRSEFGEKRAGGAVVAYREQSVLDYFERRREEREHPLVHARADDPWRGPQGGAEDCDRSRRDDRSDNRGGGRSSFGGR